MFGWLGLDVDETLSAYFIPFRSPRYELLPRRREAWNFAVDLWRRIFAEVRPPLVVCIGGAVERGLRQVWGHPTQPVQRFPIGWGDYTAGLTSYSGHLLLRLPHLSTFTIFGRPASVEPLAELRKAIDHWVPPSG
jgi:hypothetical protein